ncbi:MAG: lysine--tRNA ligase [Coriobacteriia bacterium]|nr:lysine--tRNA ligase [Coriobacteriia bacterium]MCL2136668.1 lysine--tRNA ligase [Coriobacteriia bacterium]
MTDNQDRQKTNNESLDSGTASQTALEKEPDSASSVENEVRLAKRQRYIDAGADPYGDDFSISHHISELEERYSALEDDTDTDDEVGIAGRIVAIRDQGKIVFMVVRDSTSEIQLFIRIDVIGEEAFAQVKELDIGDWVNAEGTVLRTRRGQLSIAPHKVKLVSKALRPLPEKFHGLADRETRYRQRYVDLIVNPEVKNAFEKRFVIVSTLRAVAIERGFIEVETPMLHAIPGGATARPFVTHHNALSRDYYLRIAPELHLKRLLVGGFERVFEINRCFRNEGMDQIHNPEFTTFEAYQAFSNQAGMKELTRELIQRACLAANGSLQITYQGNEIDLSGEWSSRTMIDLVSEAAGTEVSFNRTLTELKTLANHYQISLQDSWGKGKIIVELYEKLVERNLVQPVFVTEHPLETSPLAKQKADDPNVTDRFELLICGSEYANAFTELNDPVEQQRRFESQLAARAAGDDEAMGFDADYIRALEFGMPPAGGMGLGVDRLTMLLTDSASIRDVLLFPHMRDEV